MVIFEPVGVLAWKTAVYLVVVIVSPHVVHTLLSSPKTVPFPLTLYSSDTPTGPYPLAL
jgi:hypothetical protein